MCGGGFETVSCVPGRSAPFNCTVWMMDEGATGVVGSVTTVDAMLTGVNGATIGVVVPTAVAAASAA